MEDKNSRVHGNHYVHYIRLVKYNVQIINDIKAPEKGFVIVIRKLQKQTSLYHSRHHTIYHRTHKIQ